ncbi:unnamed protein product, partial [Prorocentrum cordatum]
MDVEHLDGEPAHSGSLLLAAAKFHLPAFGRGGGGKSPKAVLSLRGLGGSGVQSDARDSGAAGDEESPPAPATAASKTRPFDASAAVGKPDFEVLLDPAPRWPRQAQPVEWFREAAERSGVSAPRPELRAPRHSSPTFDQATRQRTLREIKLRGRWMSDTSAQCRKKGRVAEQLHLLPVAVRVRVLAPASSVPMDQIKQMLKEHTAGIVAEVQKSLLGSGAPGDGLDISALTLLLSERDKEVQALEAKLAGLNSELGAKDQRMAELSGELDAAVREVRHRQLDLEFQQLKLEERVRSNAELEQSQRVLAARVEEAGLQARHAALDAEMGTMGTPRSIRAQ